MKLLKNRKIKGKNSSSEATETKTADQPNQEEFESAIAKKYGKKIKIKKWIKRIIGIVLLLLLAFGIFKFIQLKTGRKEVAAEPQTTSIVNLGSFDSRVTGSGTVQPIESYTLSSFIEGEILTSPYNEGELVEEGAVLYTFDATEAQTKIQSAQSALRSAQRAVESADKQIEQAAKSIERANKSVSDARNEITKVRDRIAKLVIKAPSSGMIEGLTAEVGDDVSGTLCRIIDYDSLTTTVSFNSLQIQSIKEGDRVSVGISSLMTSVGGTVDRKYTAPHAGSDGTIMYSVRIKVDSGVRLAAGTTVSVTVHTASGDIESPSYGTISYADPKDVTIPEGGEIIELAGVNGNHISAGSVLARLRSEYLEKELERANEAYQDALDGLQDAKDN